MTANEESDDVSLLSGTGCGWQNSPDPCSTTRSFQLAASFPLPRHAQAQGIAVGDLDGDHLPDLVVADPNKNEVSLLRNNGGTGSDAFDPGVSGGRAARAAARRPVHSERPGRGLLGEMKDQSALSARGARAW